MGICGNVQQQNCDVLVDICYRDTPNVSKMAQCFNIFLQIYRPPVYEQGYYGAR